jgi:hypothetical protein
MLLNAPFRRGKDMLNESIRALPIRVNCFRRTQSIATTFRGFTQAENERRSYCNLIQIKRIAASTLYRLYLHGISIRRANVRLLEYTPALQGKSCAVNMWIYP